MNLKTPFLLLFLLVCLNAEMSAAKRRRATSEQAARLFKCQSAITLLTTRATSLHMSEHIQEKDLFSANFVTTGLRLNPILLAMSEHTPAKNHTNANFVITVLQIKAI